MKAIILAAGKSTRTYPLTVTKPKPLLKLAGKTLLEYNLEQLDGIVDEVIIVVGYKKEMVMEMFGDRYKSMKLIYVEQKEQLGSGHALMQVKDILKGKFIVMNGDDLFSKKDIKACIRHKYCVLAKKVENPERYGVLGVVNGHVIKIVEKPQKFVSDLANTGLYVLDKDIFKIEIKKSPRGEYEIIDYLHSLIKKKNLNYETVTGYWLSIGYPWDLLDSNDYLLRNLKSDIKGVVEDNVTIKGEIVIEESSCILSGVYIEGNVVIGKNCKIGPNCYLRGPVSIGDNCHIGQAVEIKNSIIGDNSNIPHLSYIGDSIIGDNVNLGAGTITANLKHDNSNVKSMINGKLIDVERRKLGCIVGDNVHTGINTSIYPGRKLWPDTSTMPGEVVKKDIM